MKREKIFKKACKSNSVTVINNTYTDENGEVHTRNQWVHLGGAAYLIDFPRTLNKKEFLYLAGVQPEKVCEGYVNFADSSESGLDLSDDFRNTDIGLDRCNFTINNKYTLFRTANGAPRETALFIDAEFLALIDDEKDVDFWLRNFRTDDPVIIAKNGFTAIAAFMPFKFYVNDCDSVLADNAFAAYKVISGK